MGQFALAAKLLAIAPDTLKFTRQRAALLVRLRATGKVSHSQFVGRVQPLLTRLSDQAPEHDAQWLALRLQCGEPLPEVLPTPELRYLASLEILRAGDIRRGFDLYRDRFEGSADFLHRVMSATDVVVMQTYPRWQGEDLVGKRVYLVLEQGAGDRLMLARYFHHLAGAREVLCEQQPLSALLAQTFPFIRWVAPGTLPAHDGVVVPAFDLPAFLPEMRADRYLEAQTQTQTQLQLQAPGKGFHVGLCWRGHPDFLEAALRDVPIKEFAALLEMPGVTFHSLCPRFRNSTHGRPLVRHKLTTWEDTASVIAGLDLVITVDTAVAHLAGALGRPVWLLNRAHGCWRWGSSGSTSRWYSSMRVFRQTSTWREVLLQVQATLAEVVK